MKKKQLLIILCVTMVIWIVLLGVAIGTHRPGESTKQDDNPSVTTVSTDPSVTTGEELDENGYKKDDLPETLNFGGEKIGILYWNDITQQEFEAESMTGELINDAIYERNLATEQRLGIKLGFTGIPGNGSKKNDFIRVVDNDVMSGSAEYDLIASYSQTPATLAMNGDSIDLNTVDYLNFSQPWWPASLLDQATIHDKLYFCSGDVSTNLLWMMTAVFFNKDMLSDLKLENPYGLVPSKAWTVDKMLEMTAGAYQDLDGDSTASKGDRYGMTLYNINVDAFFTSAGLVVIDKDSNGDLQVSDKYNSEIIVDLIGKLGNWINSSGDVILSTSTSIRAVFGEGRSLFIMDRVFIAKTVLANTAQFGYGIVPVPIYSSEQTEYKTNVGYPFTMYSISSALKEDRINRAGAVLECMASESYRKVTPVVFETAMKIKYSEDEEASSMYDMIRSNIDFDPGRLYVNELGSTAAPLFRNCVQNNDTAWASKYSSVQKVLTRGCKTITETLG